MASRNNDRKDRSPERMPPVTVGIEMSRGTLRAGLREKLTGANAPADETGAADMVCEYIDRMNGRRRKGRKP